MKKLILLTLTALIMVGCGDTNNCKVHTVDLYDKYNNYSIVILDSCEYIKRDNSKYDNGISHKGNCRFCEERDSIKWEKRKKELEELVKLY